MEENNAVYHMVMDDSELFYAEVYSRDVIKKTLESKLLLLLVCSKNNIELNPRCYLAQLELELKKRGIEINGDLHRLADDVKRLGINIDAIMDSDPDAYYHFKTEEEFTLEDDLSLLKYASERGLKPAGRRAELMAELKKYGLKLDADTDIKQLAENLRLIRQYGRQGA